MREKKDFVRKKETLYASASCECVKETKNSMNLFVWMRSSFMQNGRNDEVYLEKGCIMRETINFHTAATKFNEKYFIVFVF